jgi:hypothetical protein
MNEQAVSCSYRLPARAPRSRGNDPLLDWISFSNTASAASSTLALLDKMVGFDPTRRHCVNYQLARTPQSYDRPDRVNHRLTF